MPVQSVTRHHFTLVQGVCRGQPAHRVENSGKGRRPQLPRRRLVDAAPRRRLVRCVVSLCASAAWARHGCAHTPLGLHPPPLQAAGGSATSCSRPAPTPPPSTRTATCPLTSAATRASRASCSASSTRATSPARCGGAVRPRLPLPSISCSRPKVANIDPLHTTAHSWTSCAASRSRPCWRTCSASRAQAATLTSAMSRYARALPCAVPCTCPSAPSRPPRPTPRCASSPPQGCGAAARCGLQRLHERREVSRQPGQGRPQHQRQRGQHAPAPGRLL